MEADRQRNRQTDQWANSPSKADAAEGMGMRERRENENGISE